MTEPADLDPRTPSGRQSTTPSGRHEPITFGRFEVVRELGRGGMGVVYLAYDSELDRELALKVPLGEIDAQRLGRLRREGEATATLDHPGIVRIHESGVQGGRPYLVYELIPQARPLNQLFLQIELPERVGMIAEAADALGFAHARGVVHRDVKPENLLVDGEGRIRVADFGLASVQGADRLTKTGILLGSLAFMAPEVLSGGALGAGPPADVWALGVTLYETLTGELPFKGQTALEMSELIRRGAPPPSRVAADVEAGVEAVCLRALSLRPEDRYPDGTSFAAALRAALAGELPPERGGDPLMRGLAGLALVAVVAAAVSLAALSGRGDVAPSEDATVPVAVSPGGQPAVDPAGIDPAGIDPSAIDSGEVDVDEARVKLDHARELARRKLALEEVLPFLEGALALAPAGSALADEVSLEMADLLRRRGRWQRSVDVGSALLDRPGRLGHRACYVVAASLRRLDDAEESERVYRRLVERDPEGAYGLCAGVVSRLVAWRRPNPSDRKAIRRALDLEPDLPTARLLQALFLSRDPESYQDAVRVLEGLVATEADDPRVYEMQARVLRRDPAQAMKALKAAIRLTEPQPHESWLGDLASLYMQQGRPEAARDVLGRLLEREERSKWLLLRGVAWSLERRPQRAETDWRRAYELDPEDCAKRMRRRPLREFRALIEEAVGIEADEPEPVEEGPVEPEPSPR